MKKLSLIILMILILVGCNKPQEKATSLKVLSPAGAPALSTIPLFDEANVEVEITAGADLVQAALVNPSSDYDAIIAPINLGVNLLNQEKTNYQLHSVVTWGNLYILGKKEALSKPQLSLAGFGEKAIVGIVLKQVVAANESLSKANLEWFGSVVDAQAALLSDKVDLAMIAMPAAQATLAKAKEMNKDIEILFDVQNLYKDLKQKDNFPQAALFVHKDKYASHSKAINEMVDKMAGYVANPVDLKAKIESIGAEKLGVPNAALIEATFSKLSINLVKANSIESDLAEFLKALNLELSGNHIIK